MDLGTMILILLVIIGAAFAAWGLYRDQKEADATRHLDAELNREDVNS